MKRPDAKRFWQEQLLLATRACEADMAARGLVPDRSRSRSRRLRSSLIHVTAFLLAASVSFFAVLANFIVLNRILHISPD